MRKSDLNPRLQQLYNSARGFGIERGKTESLKNIWFVIPPPPPDETPAGLNPTLLKEAHRVLGLLPRLESLSPMDELVLGLLVKREALQSSRMEGTFSTIEQVLTPGELFDKREKSPRASVIGYAHALEAAFDGARRKGVKIFSEDLVRRMHKAMMAHDPEYRGQPGMFRYEIGDGVYARIGGVRPEDSTYNPAPPGHVAKGLKQNLHWLRDETLLDLSRAGMGPGLVIRMARAHWHFEAVHPFSDGNGRVGRILMTLQMVCEGFAPLYLSGYIEVKKREYSRALNQAQMQLDEVPLIHFLSEAIIESWNESQKTKAALLALPAQWNDRGKFRADSAAKRALELLLQFPILTTKHLEQRLAVSNPAALRAMTQLCEAGILRERTGFARNRIFAAEEVVELLGRQFGEPPETALERACARL